MKHCYESVDNCIDIEDKSLLSSICQREAPPSRAALLTPRPALGLWRRTELPLFGKEGRPACAKPRLPEPRAAGRRFGEGRGEGGGEGESLSAPPPQSSPVKGEEDCWLFSWFEGAPWACSIMDSFLTKEEKSCDNIK